MFLLSPEILHEATGLSIVGCLGLWLPGIFLYLFGWRWHRFWVVLGMTFGGGVLGMVSGQLTGIHVLIVGLLLSVSAGLLAQELAKVLTFASGGMAAWWAVHAVVPAARDLWAVFLIGGLSGILLYRLWMMAITAFAGAMLASYGLILLLARLLRFDAALTAETDVVLFNILLILTTAMGLPIQAWLDRRGQRKATKRKGGESDTARTDESHKPPTTVPHAAPPPTPGH